MKVRTTYTCPACGISSLVDVALSDDPMAQIPEQSREILRRAWVVRQQAGEDPGPEPVDALAQEIAQRFAASKLVWATCPRCHARNPVGEARHALSRRVAGLTGVVVAALFAATAWLWPWFGTILAAVGLISGVVAAIRAAAGSARAPWWLHVGQVVIPLVLVVETRLAPHAAWLAPLVLWLPGAVSGGADAGAWAATAPDLVFVDPDAG